MFTLGESYDLFRFNYSYTHTRAHIASHLPTFKPFCNVIDSAVQYARTNPDSATSLVLVLFSTHASGNP